MEAVAPFAGAWIEIVFPICTRFKRIVAPFAGAWIEIIVKRERLIYKRSRSLRGSVD